MVLVLGFSVVAAQDKGIHEELKNLEGQWKRESVEVDGKTYSSEVLATDLTLIISGNKWTWEHGYEVSMRPQVLEVRLNPAKRIKEIDFLTKAGEKEALPGIYQLEGDTLITAVSYPIGGDLTRVKRPTEFKTKQGDGVVITTYKRVKEQRYVCPTE